MERQFTLSAAGVQIPCKLYEPDHCAPLRVIIGVHGFCGDKDSAVLTSIADEMGIFGAACLCFDFPGHGDSPLTDRALSLPTCIQTLATVADWAKEEYPAAKVCLFATGFGAFVTTLVLEELNEMLDGIRLVMQTPDFEMSKTLLTMTEQTEDAFRSTGRVTLGKPGSRMLEVPFSFYEELKNAEAAHSHEIPMLLIHGENDEVVPLEDVRRFLRNNDEAKLVVIPGADHQFRGEGQWDMVVDLTRDWFEYQQILLCDCE